MFYFISTHLSSSELSHRSFVIVFYDFQSEDLILMAYKDQEPGLGSWC